MLSKVNLGGPGSGFFKHKGRKGFRGGSLPSGHSGPSNDDERELNNYFQTVDKVTGARSKESYVMRNGQFYDPQPLPKGIKRGKPKLCYMNAYNLAMSSNGEYTYVEGFAVPDFAPIPIEHAWVVDSEGNVIDNTWQTPGSVYFGIPFSDDEVSQIISETETYGAIGRGNKKYEEYISKLRKFSDNIQIIVELGGPGSGNKGHKGRPGQVGGSQPNENPTIDDEVANAINFHYQWWEKVNDEMSTDEYAALMEYSDGLYKNINSYFRKKLSFNDEEKKYFDKVANDLDNAISRSKADREFQVYRGIGLKKKSAIKKATTVGEIFSDPAFFSTSGSEYQAKNFMDTNGGPGQDILFSIKVPQGQSIMPALTDENAHEVEFLFPRNTKFKVLSVKKVKRKVRYEPAEWWEVEMEPIS